MILRSQARIQDDSDGSQYTTFDFAKRDLGGTNTYKFTLESDDFIQLCVLGNIIQPRKNGSGLEGVAQHLEDFCRVKKDNINIGRGHVATLKINDFCRLRVRLLSRSHDTKHEEDGPVTYEIEVGYNAPISREHYPMNVV